MSNEYYKKYIKYKNRYLKLKKQIGSSVLLTPPAKQKRLLSERETTNLGDFVSLSKGSNKKNIDQVIASIYKSDSKSFQFADIQINDPEKQIIKKIKISEYKVFEYYGVFDKNKIKKYISDFVDNLNNTEKVSNVVANIMVSKVISPFLESVKKDSAWITIRAFPPKDEIYVPRWHRDGYYYRAKEFYEKDIILPKLAFVIKGAPTLFKDVDPDGFEKYKELYKELYKDFWSKKKFDREKDIENRKQIDKSLDKYKTDKPTNDQAAIFVVGSDSRAALHSEPPINKTRLFLSIVPGDETDIKELASRWNKEFSKPLIS